MLCQAIALMLGFSAVEAAATTQEIAHPSRDDVVLVAATDPEMEEAKEAGRASLPYFLARMSDPAEDETEFSVKFDLIDGDDAEFIWAGELRREGQRLTGVLLNEPLNDQFRVGQRVSISVDDIIDWNYIKSGVAQGHHTTRVILTRISPDQAASVRERLGW